MNLVKWQHRSLGTRYEVPVVLPSINTIRNEQQQAPQNSCRILALPPELRNSIWELAHAPDFASEVERVNFFRLGANRGPSNDLLLTCRQIYSEAAGIYNAAQERYWNTTTFSANAKDAEDLDDDTILARLGESTILGKIQRLKIETDDKEHTYVFNRGIWRCEGQGCRRCPQGAILNCSKYVLRCVLEDLEERLGCENLGETLLLFSGYTFGYINHLPDELSEEDIQYVQRTVEWEGLTKKDVANMFYSLCSI